MKRNSSDKPDFRKLLADGKQYLVYDELTLEQPVESLVDGAGATSVIRF